MEPITPQVEPMAGKVDAGGARGKMQRRQADLPGITVVAWPWKPQIAP
jgi:hypothetical protein